VGWRMKRTVAVLMLCSMTTVLAKGATRRVVITGGTLAPGAHVEATNSAALANVWAGAFLGDPAEPPGAGEPRYQVSFYVVPPREHDERVMYVVRYVRDPSMPGGGFVYLPGRGEEYYSLNVSTILRPEQDGRWHRARADWSRAINSALP